MRDPTDPNSEYERETIHTEYYEKYGVEGPDGDPFEKLNYKEYVAAFKTTKIRTLIDELKCMVCGRMPSLKDPTCFGDRLCWDCFTWWINYEY
jgi:hypothetical protein